MCVFGAVSYGEVRCLKSLVVFFLNLVLRKG